MVTGGVSEFGPFCSSRLATDTTRKDLSHRIDPTPGTIEACAYLAASASVSPGNLSKAFESTLTLSLLFSSSQLHVCSSYLAGSPPLSPIEASDHACGLA
jgi:hypothetical protein